MTSTEPGAGGEAKACAAAAPASGPVAGAAAVAGTGKAGVVGVPPACHDPRQVVQPDKKRLLARLSRVEGQVRGVARMVEEDRYCVDVLTQLAAVKAALNQVSLQLLENHARGCVARAMREGEGEAAVDELLAVLKRLDGKAFG